MKIKFLAILLTIFSQLLYGTNSFKFTVSPPIIHLKLHPGSTEEVELRVQNKDEAELNLNIKTYPLAMDKSGNAVVGEDQRFSCSAWLEPARNSVSIPPDSTAFVAVKIKVPFNVSGGRYGVVMFETSRKMQREKEILLTGRMGTILMIELYGRKQFDSRIMNFSIAGNSNPIDFSVTIRNHGNIHITAKGSILISGEDGRIVDRVNLNTGTGTILPENSRIFSAIWQNERKIIPGAYRAKVRIIIPGIGRVLEGEKVFYINK